MTMKLTSTAFAEGAGIPIRHTCDGDDVSPALAWSGAPAGTRSFAVLCDDPDAPAGTWHHWAVYDIPADSTSLPEDYPTQETVGATRQAVNSFGRSGYGGPCPPPGHGVHHYHFRVLALSCDSLGLPAGADFNAVATAAESHVMEQAELIGTYKRG
jgi:Raf kinase inhibitor-like YbhB/YbcL family protein